MQIVVLYNPVSGAGRSQHAGRYVADRLEQAGHEVVCVATALEPAVLGLDRCLGFGYVVVVGGGEGGLGSAAGSAVRHAKALYHFPGGTENLFAREFGMDRTIDRLVTALDRFDTKDIDLATANGALMVLMASIGFDAEVVHDLAACRGASISHLSYVPPMSRQLFQWSPTKVTITVDGREIVNNRAGFVVIANSRQYAARLNPAWKACMHDGLLDILFLPVATRSALLKTMFMHGIKQQARLKSTVYERGRAVVVHCDRPAHFQVDGDPPAPLRLHHGDQRASVLNVSLMNHKLRVLLPG
jgi:diacylglycerol kinase family enzyme